MHVAFDREGVEERGYMKSFFGGVEAISERL